MNEQTQNQKQQMPKEKDWWKKAVFYQVYPKSFQDTNHDGTGDLNGVTQHLDDLQDLGITGIWMSPFFQSPQADNGYDISDYRQIDPSFGTMQDMERLIEQAHERGISIVIDLVLNHTSEKHPWFLEAKKSRNNPYHDYYIWQDKKPNDMGSIFGGSAWQYVPEIDQYYFHQYLPAQPDLNWSNPKVRQEIYDVVRFWKEKGVNGFRLDALDVIGKDPANGIAIQGPKLHEYIREMSAEVFDDPSIVTMGEAWSADVDEARLYSNPDGSELSMVFQFEQMMLDYGKEKWDAGPLPLVTFKKTIRKWQNGLQETGWNPLFLENHDLPRIISRWADGSAKSAKMLAAMYLCLQGTPFIYQGQEIGMVNLPLPIEEYADMEVHNMYNARRALGIEEEHIMKGIHKMARDNARTPMQWSDQENAGFSDVKPWLPVNPNYKTINVQSERKDPDSVLNFYKKLIALRNTLPVIEDGTFDLIEEDNPDVFAYTRTNGRQKLTILCNFRKKPVPFEKKKQLNQEAELILSNEDLPSDLLRPYETSIYLEDLK